MISGFLLSFTVQAQVDEIIKKSSEHSSGRERGGSSGSSGIYIDVFVQSLTLVGDWQRHTLQKREEIPHIISLDVLLQTAVQPASYYIVNPRIRGNWGLFSTDFRVNYLIEEGIDGTKHIRTDDWQILQVNMVTTRNVIFRFGGGFLHEDFSGGKTFQEWTAGFHVNSNDHRLGGMTEYRWSEPRKEWNGQVQCKLFQTGHFHGYVTGGVVFQRYYQAITVWGMQGGLMFKLY
jgi:hypothetical protein